ncbi:MAG: hypothetical protein AAF738_09455, partial [Bacteroidota bacterium]
SSYLADTLQGERKLYYADGGVHYLERYKDGQYHGKYEAFHPNGQLALVGNYVQNMMQGEWIGYYENGQMKERVQFEDNLENGAFTEWYENGNRKATGTYSGGDKEHGELFLYDETGILTRKMNCEHGRCATTWKRPAEK